MWELKKNGYSYNKIGEILYSERLYPPRSVDNKWHQTTIIGVMKRNPK